MCYCDRCGEGFRDIKEMFLVHNDEHDFERFACSSCEHTFKTTHALDEHYVESHIETDRVYFTCSKCKDQNFTDIQSYVQHMREHHSAPYPSFKCFFCNNISITLKNFQTHLFSEHYLAKVYKCGKCSHVSPTPKHLHIHKASKHSAASASTEETGTTEPSLTEIPSKTEDRVSTKTATENTPMEISSESSALSKTPSKDTAMKPKIASTNTEDLVPTKTSSSASQSLSKIPKSTSEDKLKPAYTCHETHFKLRHNSNQLLCNHCDCWFLDMKALEAHKIFKKKKSQVTESTDVQESDVIDPTHTKPAPQFVSQDGRELFKCEKCTTVFLEGNERDHHFKLKHDPSQFPCIRCNRWFNDMTSLNVHLRLDKSCKKRNKGIMPLLHAKEILSRTTNKQKVIKTTSLETVNQVADANVIQKPITRYKQWPQTEKKLYNNQPTPPTPEYFHPDPNRHFPGPNSNFPGPNPNFQGPHPHFPGQNQQFPLPNPHFHGPNAQFSVPNNMQYINQSNFMPQHPPNPEFFNQAPSFPDPNIAQYNNHPNFVYPNSGYFEPNHPGYGYPAPNHPYQDPNYYPQQPDPNFAVYNQPAVMPQYPTPDVYNQVHISANPTYYPQQTSVAPTQTEPAPEDLHRKPKPPTIKVKVENVEPPKRSAKTPKEVSSPKKKKSKNVSVPKPPPPPKISSEQFSARLPDNLADATDPESFFESFVKASTSHKTPVEEYENDFQCYYCQKYFDKNSIKSHECSKKSKQ